MRFTAAIRREDELYVAQCLEVDVASQGETVEASLTNLREALELYLESAEPISTSTQPTLVATIDVAVPAKAAS